MNACRICLQTFTRGTSLDRHLVTTRCGDLLKEARRRRVEAATSVDGVSIDGHASKRHRSDDDNNADCDIGNPDDGDMHNFYAENDFVPIADIADDDINATDGFVDDDSEDSSEYFDESSDEDDVAAGVDEQRRVDGDDGDGDGGAVEGDFDKDLSHALHELIHQACLFDFGRRVTLFDDDVRVRNEGNQTGTNRRQTSEVVKRSRLEGSTVNVSARAPRIVAASAARIEAR